MALTDVGSTSIRNRGRLTLAIFTLLTVLLVTYYTNHLLGITVRSLRPVRTRNWNETLRFVSMCSANFDRRRLGNQLFNWAAVLYVARLTGAQPAMLRRHPYGWIDRWFDVGDVHHVDTLTELCPCAHVTGGRSLAFDTSLATRLRRPPLVGARGLLVCGLFQSWRYPSAVVDELRRRLRWKSEILSDVRTFLDSARPSSSSWKSIWRIGVHVRASDILTPFNLYYGFTVPGQSYFIKAANFLTANQASPVQYVIATDNLEWTRKNIALEAVFRANPNVSVVYSEGRSAGFDMALLASCDALILSTGSYGWWAAWLANKTTVYYRNWPRAGSIISTMTSREDYFPAHWIGLGSESDHTRDIPTNSEIKRAQRRQRTAR